MNERMLELGNDVHSVAEIHHRNRNTIALRSNFLRNGPRLSSQIIKAASPVRSILIVS